MHGKINDWEGRAEARLKRPAIAALGVALVIGGFVMAYSGGFEGLDVVLVIVGAILTGLNARPMNTTD